jgi:integrase/recombinase XerD
MTRSASPGNNSASPGQLPEHLHSPFWIFLQSLDETLSVNTRAAYRRDVQRYLEFLDSLGVSSLEAIGPDHVHGLLEKLREQGLSAASLARNTSSIRRFHRFLQARNLCHRNPAERLTAAKPIRQSPDFLSIAEAKRLVETARGDHPLDLRDRAILELLYASGMTASELIQLNEGDVLPQSGLVRILGKGARERTIPIGEPAVESLNRYNRARPGLLSNLNPEDISVFFLNARGRALSRMSVWKIIKSAARAARIQREVSPHTLRHTFAAHLVDGGGDVRDVQQLMGHASMSTTLIYGSHTDPQA